MSRLLVLTVLLVACDIGGAETGVEEAPVSCPSSVNPIANPGFETGTLAGWKHPGKVAAVQRHHSGTRSARVGSTKTFTGTSKLSQVFTVPPGPSTLSVWMWPACADPSGDRLRVELRSASGALLATLFNGCSNARVWTRLERDTTVWSGQSVRLQVIAVDDGGDPSYLNVDDAVVESIAPPTVTFTTPAEQSFVGSHDDLPISVTAATSPCATLAGLDLFEIIDGIEWPIVLGSTSPISVTMPATYPAGGPRSYLARASDSAGNVTEAARHIVRSDVWSASTEALVATDAAIDPDEMAFGAGRWIAQIDRFTGVWRVIPFLDLGGTVNPPLLAGDQRFATAQNGRLYRVDGPSTVSIDLKRGLGCVPDDSLRAAPAELDGRLFVPTYHECGDHALNQVIAFDIDTLGELWRFNQFSEYQVDAFSSACAVDPAADRIYCAARAFSAQSTLFALDAATGALVWSVAAGSLVTTPALDATRRVLYVGDTSGVLHSVHADTGADLGSMLLASCATGLPCALDTPVLGDGLYAQMVFVTDARGALHAVYDGEEEMFEVWSNGGPPVYALRGRPALDLVRDQLYIGDRTGRLHQIALGNGNEEWSVQVLTGGGTVGTPILVDDNSDGALDHALLVIDGLTGAGAAKKLPIPLQ